MNQESRAGRRAALFVDFDNIFIGLGGASSEAAVSFGTKPAAWLRWLERGVAGAEAEPGACRFLVRRCYLNPESFRTYRPYFIRAAFEVIDCPPLTSTGKTSADMSMALDIVDALHHTTHFDDFVVLSGDADFRPVLLRLRQHDRRTAILPIGPVSPAYRASADLLLNQDEFVEGALNLGGRERSGRAVAGAGAPSDLRVIAARIAEQVGAAGQVSASDLPQLYMSLPAFTSGSDWLGFGTLRRMTEAVLTEAPELGVEEEGDAWRIVLRADHPAAVGAGAWNGKSRKSPVSRRPPARGGDAVTGETFSDAEIEATARRISDLTDIPLLSSADYARVFAAIAQEIGENGYHLTQTAKSTHARLAEKDIRVGRSEIGLILKGLAFRYGERLGRRLRHEELAQGFADNVEQLCARAQLSLSAEDSARLRRWIGGS